MAEPGTNIQGFKLKIKFKFRNLAFTPTTPTSLFSFFLFSFSLSLSCYYVRRRKEAVTGVGAQFAVTTYRYIACQLCRILLYEKVQMEGRS